LKAPIKWPWRGAIKEHRLELLMFGEPDCFGLIMRYQHKCYGGAWCWTLSMPRGGKDVARGWARDPHTAKRQVETAVKEHWF
jgi:hypothetical protein